MSVIGCIESLWRYPVKSMAGEELDEAFLGFAGVYGDRLFAFRSSASPAGHPFLTAREQAQMLRYRPRFRHPAKAALPANLAEAERIAPGLTPAHADPAELAVDIETPSGDLLAIDDPALISMLLDGLDGAPELALVRSERAMTDCRPVSLFAVQTARAVGDLLGRRIDKRRFRANVYLDLESSGGYDEDAYVGRRLRIGRKAVVSVLERDPRCKVVTIDPETAESDPHVLRPVAQDNDGTAGVYGAVLVEGAVRRGDEIEVLD